MVDDLAIMPDVRATGDQETAHAAQEARCNLRNKEPGCRSFQMNVRLPTGRRLGRIEFGAGKGNGETARPEGVDGEIVPAHGGWFGEKGDRFEAEHDLCIINNHQYPIHYKSDKRVTHRIEPQQPDWDKQLTLRRDQRDGGRRQRTTKPYR